MAKTSKMRVIDSVDTPVRTFYDIDLDFNELNEINKRGRRDDIEIQEEAKIFDKIFAEDEEDVCY